MHLIQSFRCGLFVTVVSVVILVIDLTRIISAGLLCGPHGLLCATADIFSSSTITPRPIPPIRKILQSIHRPFEAIL